MELKDRLFTIILSCEKYRHKMLSQDTSRLGDHMYFIGDPALSSPLVKGEVVYLPCPDNYESLSVKSMMAVKWVVQNKDFDLLLKTDDDVVFLDGFDQIVDDASKSDYSGLVVRGDYDSDWHFGKCESKELNNMKLFVPRIFYCMGGAYFLSKKAALIVANHRLEQDYFIFEDVQVGAILWRSKIFGQRVLIEKAFSWPQ
jgi:hypothetical protein